MIVPIVFNIIVSFSSGVYIAMVPILLIIFYKFINSKIVFRIKILYIIFALIMVSTIIYNVKNEFIHTIVATETVSQNRSILGRLDAGEVSVDILKENLFLGVGTGNFSLAANKYLYENNKFAFFSSSILFQLFAEKGVVGAILWVLFIIIIVYFYYCNRLISQHKSNWLIITLLFVIIIRELTHSLFFEYSSIQLIVFTLLAIFQNRIQINNYSLKTKYIKYIPIVLGLLFFINNLNHYFNEMNNNNAIIESENNNIHGAIKYINMTDKSLPYLVNRSILYEKLFDNTNNKCYLDSAEMFLKDAIEKNNLDNQLKNNLAWIFYKKGDSVVSKNMFSHLSSEFKDNYLYIYSLSIINYNEGDINNAVRNLSKAIMLNPNILDYSFYKEIKESNSNFNLALSNHLISEIDTTSNDPLYIAKMGKLMLSLGFKDKANELLKQAIASLPNLSRPWCYMAIIEFEKNNIDKGLEYINKSMVLAPFDNLPLYYYNVYVNKSYPKKITEFKLPDNYVVKFKRWYNSNIINI